MLGKLIKYEFKSTSRTFLPMYIALILVAAGNRLFRGINIDVAFAISSCILVALFMALGIVTLVVIIQRFNKNLLGDEGYLMFTLPVKSSQLVLSKYLISIFWNVLSFITAFLTFIILLGDHEFFTALFTDFGALWTKFNMITLDQFHMSAPVFSLAMISIVIVSYTNLIFEIYLSLAAAQLPKFNKHRGLVAFAAFFIINVIISIATEILSYIVPINHIHTFGGSYFYFIIPSIVVCIALFLGIKYVLEKHLNLE